MIKKRDVPFTATEPFRELSRDPDDTVKLIKDAGYRFELATPGSPHLGSANGVTVGGDVMLVQVRNDVSTAQQLKTTIHELAHIRCDHLTGARIGETPIVFVNRREGTSKVSRHEVFRSLGTLLLLGTAAFFGLDRWA